MIVLKIASSQREEMLDITFLLREVVASQSWRDGALLVYCPHTTCGLTINEGADPDVQRDLVRFFQEIAPQIHGWKHAEGNTDAHIRASLLGASLLVPLDDGKICLGRWQKIFMYEGDGPRNRSLYVQRLDEKK